MACQVTGCPLPNRSGRHPLCDAHYQRVRNHGDLQADVPIRTRSKAPDAERFWSLVEKTPMCWLWRGRRHVGYGVFSVRDRRHPHRTVNAHRWAWEALRGPVEPGLHLDHLCRVRACVNPDHLEPVTRKVNILRGVSPAAIYARRDACLRGHRFDEANTLIGRRGDRICRACCREREARYVARTRYPALRRAA
jgi:hypothetical protein